MSIALAVLGGVLIVIGVLGTVFPGLPGAVLILAGFVLLAWLDGFVSLGVPTLVVLGVLTLLAHAVDPIATALGAQRVGASRRAIVGAMLGGLVGLFFGLPGILLGPFAGAFIGELSHRGAVGDATRVGLGTWLGLLVGLVVKLTLVFAMLGIGLFAFLS